MKSYEEIVNNPSCSLTLEEILMSLNDVNKLQKLREKIMMDPIFKNKIKEYINHGNKSLELLMPKVKG
ncbi:MAG: hypothetical protein RR359_02250 [Bacilli bacterium]